MVFRHEPCLKIDLILAGTQPLKKTVLFFPALEELGSHIHQLG